MTDFPDRSPLNRLITNGGTTINTQFETKICLTHDRNPRKKSLISFLQVISKKDFGSESRHIRVVNRRHTGVCRGFSRRINAEFGTKDFLRWLVKTDRVSNPDYLSPP
jgi:hypothetical protein